MFLASLDFHPVDRGFQSESLGGARVWVAARKEADEATVLMVFPLQLRS